MDATKSVDLLRQMLLIRQLEAQWTGMYNREEIDGTPPALSLGQEAVSVGACAALEPGDFVFAAHRGQGPQVARGLDPGRILAELAGRHTGYNKGKANYHVTDVSRGVIGMGGIIGAQAPIAAGMALAQKQKGTDRVSVSIFGDGAANEGAVHEAANLAAIWNLPVIFLCENNEYCVTLRASDGMKIAHIADRAPAYGLPGMLVDGNDVLAMHEAMAQAVARARTGGGATWIEAKTYRLSGHLAHDPQVYRSKEEVAAHWAQCPIRRHRERLAAQGLLTPTQWERMQQEVQAQVEQAMAFTLQSPLPPVSEAFEDLWAPDPRCAVA